MGDKVGEIHVMAGLGNGFVFLLGDFQEVIDQAESKGITVLDVALPSFSREEIANLKGAMP
jgi:hypothetical protein